MTAAFHGQYFERDPLRQMTEDGACKLAFFLEKFNPQRLSRHFSLAGGGGCLQGETLDR